MSKIRNIIARQIFDSRGNPTVEVDVLTQKVFRKSCSTGINWRTRSSRVEMEVNHIWEKVFLKLLKM